MHIQIGVNFFFTMKIISQPKIVDIDIPGVILQE